GLHPDAPGTDGLLGAQIQRDGGRFIPLIGSGFCGAGIRTGIAIHKLLGVGYVFGSNNGCAGSQVYLVGSLCLNGCSSGQSSVYKGALGGAFAEIQLIVGNVNGLDGCIFTGSVQLFKAEAGKINGFQSGAAADVDFLQSCALVQTGNVGEGGAVAEVHAGHSGQTVHTGEVADLSAGQIQGVGKLLQCIQRQAGLLFDGGQQGCIGE